MCRCPTLRGCHNQASGDEAFFSFLPKSWSNQGGVRPRTRGVFPARPSTVTCAPAHQRSTCTPATHLTSTTRPCTPRAQAPCPSGAIRWALKAHPAGSHPRALPRTPGRVLVPSSTAKSSGGGGGGQRRRAGTEGDRRERGAEETGRDKTGWGRRDRGTEGDGRDGRGQRRQGTGETGGAKRTEEQEGTKGEDFSCDRTSHQGKITQGELGLGADTLAPSA